MLVWWCMHWASALHIAVFETGCIKMQHVLLFCSTHQCSMLVWYGERQITLSILLDCIGQRCPAACGNEPSENVDRIDPPYCVKRINSFIHMHILLTKLEVCFATFSIVDSSLKLFKGNCRHVRYNKQVNKLGNRFFPKCSKHVSMHFCYTAQPTLLVGWLSRVDCD